MADFLNDLGYDSFTLPKGGINPLALLRQEKEGLTLIGSLDILITASEQNKLPACLDNKAANLQGEKFSETNINLGLEIFKNLLNNLGGDAAGLDILFHKANKISFSAIDTTISRVNILDLEFFLNNPNNRLVLDQLINNDEGNPIFIITDVLKTNSYLVEAYDEHNEKIDLNIPEIKDIIKGGLHVDNSAGNKRNLEISGSKELTYGYKAAKIESKNINAFKFWQKPVVKYSVQSKIGLKLNE
jgi:hypothetical protein